MLSRRLHSSRFHSALLITVVIGGVTIGAFSPAAAGVTSHSFAKTTGPISTQDNVANDPQVSLQTDPGANNSFRRHRNPETAGRVNRLQNVQEVLRERLETRLSTSAVKINQGRYKRAQSLLGQEYLDQFKKYADITTERNDDSATSRIKTLNETRTRQREYAQTVEEFRQNYAEYREAKRQGNDERARQLARKLVNLGKQTQQEATELNESYSQLNTETGANVGTAREQIQEVQADIDQNRQSIEQQEFISTALAVNEVDTQGSFLDPIVIKAKLTGADNPISNREISLGVGNQTYAATTNNDGEFTVQYRPTTIPTNASEITVTYLPANSSVYTGSNVSIPVEIQAVTGQITIDTATSQTAFGDPVIVNGTVTVADEPVPGLPLAVLVDDQQLGTVVTAPDGSFRFRRQLPAGPNVGEQTVTVRTLLTGRSVSATPASRPIRIRGTPTSLSATAVRDEEIIQVSGELTTDSSPLSGRQVVISSGNKLIATARTKSNGSYIFRIDEDDLNRTAVVRFNGAGTNLNSTETSVFLPSGQNNGTRIGSDTKLNSADTLREQLSRLVNFLLGGEIPSSNTGAPIITALLTSPLVLVGGGLILGLCGAILTFIQRQHTTSNSSDAIVSSDSSTSETSAAQSSVDLLALLRSVETELEADNHTEAITQAYSIARFALIDRRNVDQARTHWQFFETCVADDIDTDLLRTLTEAYENARYGAKKVSPATAESALSAARTLVESESDTQAGQSERQ